MRNKYPLRILPRSNYRPRLPMRKLLIDYPNLAVVRRCKYRNPFAISESGNRKTLLHDALELNLLEMSVNLLGGRYKMKHLPYNPERELVLKEWDGCALRPLPIPKTDYNCLTEWGSIAFRVTDVNQFVFPYLKYIDKKQYAQLMQAAQTIQEKEKIVLKEAIVGVFGKAENNMTKVYARMHVNHHPNPMNYWHMQMDVYAVGKHEYVKHDDGSNEARRIRQQMREFFSRKAICKLGKRYHIAKRYYMHGTGFCSLVIDGLLNWIENRCFKSHYVQYYE